MDRLVCTFDQRNHGHRVVRWNAKWCSLWCAIDLMQFGLEVRKCDTCTGQSFNVFGHRCRCFHVNRLSPELPLSQQWPKNYWLGGYGSQSRRTCNLAMPCQWYFCSWNACLLIPLDDRVTWGCSVIGCPSYIDLMEHRLKKSQLTIGPPHLPKSFCQLLDRVDPGSIFRHTGNIPDSLKKKHILVLSGEDDPLVPWSAQESFISKLQQESNNVQVKVYPGVKHEFSAEMRQDFRSWFLQFI